MERVYSYYPGCTARTTAREFNESFLAVCNVLGVNLQELPDWNCCGATAAHTIDEFASLSLPLRNLLIAERIGNDVVATCPECFSRLKFSMKSWEEDGELREELKKAIGGSLEGTVRVKHALQVFIEDVGLKEIKKHIVKPLKGLKAVCYYGCVLSRPPKVAEFEKDETPESMDRLLKIAGAEPVNWSYKTDCCGGSIGVVKPEIGKSLVSRLLREAKRAGADCIVTSCSLCFSNLETRREENEDMPVFYVTELLALSMGAGNPEDWFSRHLVDPMPFIKRLGLL